MVKYWITVLSLDNCLKEIREDKYMEGKKDRLMKVVKEKMSIGDKVVYYVMGVGKIALCATVVGEYCHDTTRFWDDDVYPHRRDLKPEIVLKDPNEWIEMKFLVEKLSFIKNKKRWGAYLKPQIVELSKKDFELIENELKNRFERAVVVSPEKVIPTTPTPSVIPSHKKIKDMILEIGKIEGKDSRKEYRLDSDLLDVIWKERKREVPDSVFEIQIAGNFPQALLKLKHAWDKWRCKAILVTTEEWGEKAKVYLYSSLHDMEDDARIIRWERIAELHDVVKKRKILMDELGI